MGKNKADNPPLFVGAWNGEKPAYWSTITLRDLFAMSKHLTPMQQAWIDKNDGSPTLEASIRYAYADAMLAEREVGGDE